MNTYSFLNFWAAWIGIIGGFTAGALMGLFFHRDTWLGGYGSWQRRMVRLGHISFFGIAFINLLYAFGAQLTGIHNQYSSWLLIIGAVAMPLLCFLSAFKKLFRHLFFIPVLCLIGGSVIFLIQGVLS